MTTTSKNFSLGQRNVLYYLSFGGFQRRRPSFYTSLTLSGLPQQTCNTLRTICQVLFQALFTQKSSPYGNPMNRYQYLHHFTYKETEAHEVKQLARATQMILEIPCFIIYIMRKARLSNAHSEASGFCFYQKFSRDSNQLFLCILIIMNASYLLFNFPFPQANIQVGPKCT